MNLFYTKNLMPPDSPTAFTLVGQEAIHASRVLRVREGEKVVATDGAGTIYTGEASGVSRDLIRVEIEHLEVHPRPTPEIIIAVGNIRKRDRLEFAIEKAVELGVQEIIVFQADHSEKQKVRMDRLESSAISAMKQSLRAWLPVVRKCNSLKEVLDQNSSVKKIVADETNPLVIYDRAVWEEKEKLIFIVGPEGGFSEGEKQLVTHMDTISLGSYRLRTETAVIAIAALFSDSIPVQSR